MRQVFVAAVLTLCLSVVLVAPVAAQPPEPGYDSEYDIREVEYLSPMFGQNLYRVVTGEDRLSLAQAHEVCEDVGLERAIGAERYRERGERMTDVFCIGDEPVEPTPEVGSIEVSGIVSGDEVAIYAEACAGVDLSVDIPVAVVNVTTETTVTFSDLEPGLYCVALNGGWAEALDNAAEVTLDPGEVESVTFTLGTLDVAVTNFGGPTQGQTVRFYEAAPGSDVTTGGGAVENCAGVQIGQDIVDGGDYQANALVPPGDYCAEVDSINGTDAALGSVTALECGELDATLSVNN